MTKLKIPRWIVIIIMIGNMYLIPLAVWQLLAFFLPNLPSNERALLTATVMLVFYSMLTWLTYERLAALAERQNWLTGSLESHSTSELILRAHERGIPVIWWDPHREKWVPAKKWYSGNRHRKIARLPFITIYVPEDERGEGDKKSARDAEPFTKKEKDSIDAERKRLKKQNARLLREAK